MTGAKRDLYTIAVCEPACQMVRRGLGAFGADGFWDASQVRDGEVLPAGPDRLAYMLA